MSDGQGSTIRVARQTGHVELMSSPNLIVGQDEASMVKGSSPLRYIRRLSCSSEEFMI